MSNSKVETYTKLGIGDKVTYYSSKYKFEILISSIETYSAATIIF